MARTGRPKGSAMCADPELTARVCENLKLGMPISLAAEAEGIHRDTVYLWMRKGAEGEEIYRAFFQAATRARAEGARSLTVRALNGGKGSHQAMFFLERRYRDEYGNVQRIEHAGHDGGAVKIATSLGDMSDEELLKIAEGG